jgi:peptide/nickel transport system ATP-binding protein
MSTASGSLVEVRGLVRHFPSEQGTVRAVDGVDLHVQRGETVGLVGESGCGKSTLGRTVLRLYEPTGGEIAFDGTDITSLTGESLRRVRQGMQMIFQDPLSSLNPRMRVGRTVAEPLQAFGLAGGRRSRRQRVAELFDLVGLSTSLVDRYPAELSGGQRQRVAIARALSVEPRFIVADEAVASLDASVAAQVINLMEELRERLSLSYLFISHDLGVVRHISDRVLVMYLGRVIESSPTRALFSEPLHPYSAALLSATPGKRDAGAGRRERIILRGDPPSPVRPPAGCRFHTRCPIGPTVRPERTVCADQEPTLSEFSPGRWVACHYAGEMMSLESDRLALRTSDHSN